MYRHVTPRLLFVILLLFVCWSAFRVIEPFLMGFTWAAVLVATFRPFHRRLEAVFGGRHWAATTVVTVLVAAFVVVPLVVVTVQAIQGAVAVFGWIQGTYQSGGVDLRLAERWPWIADLVERGKHLVGLANVDLRATAMAAIEAAAAYVAAKAPGLVGGAFGLAFSFVVMLIGIPVLFNDGERFVDGLADALPIPPADAHRILGEIGRMTRTVFVSVGLTAAAQALLGGLGLLVLGVPHVLPLTALMFFFALLPAGTAVVWLPAAVWLAAQGSTVSAVVLVAWGGGVVSTIDNVLRPMVAGGGVKLSGVALFLGMFGGMAAFGIVGLFLGPIALYLVHELVAILRRDIYDDATPSGA
jgi:predicted PurR-regulated permease PerM